MSVIKDGHDKIPVIIQQDLKLLREGIVCQKFKDSEWWAGYMQGYIPRLFDQSVTMQITFVLSIFQHNLLCAKWSDMVR